MKLTAPKRALARSAAGLGLALTLAATGVMATASAAQAQTQPGTTGYFGFSGGLYASQTKAYHYSTGTGDQVGVTASADHGEINVSVQGAIGDYWYLNIDATAGKALVPGVYTGATEFPFNAYPHPGIFVWGVRPSCNRLNGSFDITKLVWGPNGYVQTLEMTFQEHCVGHHGQMNGRVAISNPALPN